MPSKSIVILQRILGLEFFAVGRPLGDVRLLNDLVEFIEDLLDVAADRDVGRFVLVQFRCIDVDMHDLGVLGERFDVTRDAIVKAHAQRDQQIAIAYRIIRVGRAVHPQPIHRLFMVRRDRTDSHDRRRHRDARLGQQLTQFLAGVRRK